MREKGFISSGPAQIRTAVTATRRPKDTKLPHRPAFELCAADRLTLPKATIGRHDRRSCPLKRPISVGIQVVMCHGDRLVGVQQLRTEADPPIDPIFEDGRLPIGEIPVIRQHEDRIG